MSARHQDLIKEIDYPESDGEPMAETGLRAQLMIDLRFALNLRFRDDPQVCICSARKPMPITRAATRRSRGVSNQRSARAGQGIESALSGSDLDPNIWR